ncbi:MAG: methyltransferase family protein [Candidatus Thorarchaeota archaeon]|jgi:protein-S-isoprenylcysteine O-methyltransferase Ste14
MVDFEEMKEKYPRGMIIFQGFWILMFSTIVTFILISPMYIFNINEQLLVDIFTFPYDLIPIPLNLIGIALMPIGLLLIAWANYALLYIGKIGLRDREPMQRPSTLVLTGPYKYSRNPIYLGILIGLFGFVIVWSSLIVFFGELLVFIIFRYKFILKEEIILEDEFGDEYREFKKRVRRWS